MEHTKQEALENVRSLGRRQARAELSAWFDRNVAQMRWSPLLDTRDVEVEGTEVPVARRTEFNGRPVLKRHPGMVDQHRLELRYALVHHAFTQTDEEPARFLSRRIPEYEWDFETVMELQRAHREGLPGGALLTLTSERGWEKCISLDEGDVPRVDGVLYLVFEWRSGRAVPRYIGITRTHHTEGHFNSTMSPTSDGKFGRWGYSRPNHLGELSCALWPDEHPWEPKRKYLEWADELFVDRSRAMSSRLMFHSQAWKGPVADAEELLIKLASRAYPGALLNTQHLDDGQKTL